MTDHTTPAGTRDDEIIRLRDQVRSYDRSLKRVTNALSPFVGEPGVDGPGHLAELAAAEIEKAKTDRDEAWAILNRIHYDPYGGPSWDPDQATATELAQAKAVLERVLYNPQDDTWACDGYTQDHIKGLVEDAHLLLWLHAEVVFFGEGWNAQWLAARQAAGAAWRRMAEFAIHKPIPWYVECIEHDDLLRADPDRYWETHFRVSDEQIVTCEERRCPDVCGGCTPGDDLHDEPVCWPCLTVAALQGDQPANLVTFLAPVDWRDQLDGADPVHLFETWIVGGEPASTCPTPCDDDCESPCHEAHAVPWKRHHDVTECEALTSTWTQASPQATPSVQASGEAQGDVAKLHDPRPRKNGAVADPDACGQCGIPEREHATQVGSDGLHTWQEPSDAQRKARMRARQVLKGRTFRGKPIVNDVDGGDGDGWCS
ncbi:hypothetical protein [Amycolatopsis speibonae]|uniref:Uncharacterized protein n=1 Tax=Amycolatopsis speibonae TaxID=1450224 RepID=A0ABV7P7X6_9PSEU